MTDILIKRRQRVKRLLIQSCMDGFSPKAMQAQSILWQIDKRIADHSQTSSVNRLNFIQR